VLISLRKQVDENGNGVFKLSEVTRSLGYGQQTNAISMHLQNLRLLSPVQRQSDGRFLWWVDLTKKRITLADIKRSREMRAARKLAAVKQRSSRKSHKSSAPKKSPANRSGDSELSDRLSSVTSVAIGQMLRFNEQRSALLEIIKRLEDNVSRLKSRTYDLEREVATLRAENTALTEQLEVVSNPDLDQEVIEVISRYQ
jgi:hypothetical protein